MAVRRIVVDTNVLVAGLRSRKGAAFRLLSLIGKGKFDLYVSVPLILEYEDVLGRALGESSLTREDIQAFLDYLCAVAVLQDIFFLWRPCLRDPKDDMVLEVAVAGGCEAIVTYNRRDFGGAESFGVKILTPAEFLKKIGGLP